MRQVMHMERRLQDLERKFQHQERRGKIVDVKFENQRWFVKFNDGSDDKPSGSEAAATSGAATVSKDETFKSDWLPWQSFSHGTIKQSIPPRKGQYSVMRSPGGFSEQASVGAFHYGPENPSPSGNQDEIVKVVENEGNSKPTETAPSIFSGGGSSLSAAAADPLSMGLSALSAAGIDINQLSVGPNLINLAMNPTAIQGIANQVIPIANDPIGIAKAAIQNAVKGLAGNMLSMVQSRMQGLMQAKNDAKTDVQHLWTRETSNTHHTIIGKKDEATSKDNSDVKDGKKNQQERTIPDVPKEGAEKTLQILATDKGYLITHGKSKATLLINQDDIFLVQDKMSIHLTKLETLISKGESKLSLTEGLITASIKDKSKVSVTEDTIKADVGESAVSVRENAVTANVKGASVIVQEKKITGNVGSSSVLIQEASVQAKVGSGSLSVQDGQVVGKVGENTMMVKDAGSKISAGGQYVVVTPGGCFSSKTIVVGPDPLGAATDVPTTPDAPAAPAPGATA